MPNKLLILLTITLFSTASIAEEHEVYMANQAGGYVVLTHEPCQMEAYKELYPYHAYATEADGTIHPGCFTIPSIAEAPEVEGMKVFAVVNFIDEDGESFVLPAHFFTSEKPGKLDGAI